MVCASCGRENAADARFCEACGAPLDAGRAAETRKVVTVVFTDVAGSTALGERLDPESLRRVMWRYFDAMQAALERHGGTVEKFIGDAVMAVFGVPAVHEDDALRAVRAAFEMRERSRAGQRGARARARRSDRDAHGRQHGRGDRRATPSRTRSSRRATRSTSRRGSSRRRSRARCSSARRRTSLVRDAVVVEPAPPIEAKGKSQPLAAWRLLGLRPDVPAFARPIAHAVRRSPARARRAPPGVRRLRCEERFVPARDDRRAARDRQVAARARALAFGRDGGARRRRPLRRVRRGDHLPPARRRSCARSPASRSRAGARRAPRRTSSAATIAARLITGAVGAERRAGLAGGDRLGVPPALRGARGRRGRSSSSWTTSTGPSRRCSTCSSTWSASRAAPRSCCSASRARTSSTRGRRGRRPGRARRSSRSPRSSDDESERPDRRRCCANETLLRARPRRHRRRRPRATRCSSSRCSRCSPTIPTPRTTAVPPTIQALLAARIDRLEPGERAVLQRASVEGRLFHRGAVAELLPSTPRRRPRRQPPRARAQGVRAPGPLALSPATTASASTTS